MSSTAANSNQGAGAWRELRSGPLITGGVLLGIGGVIALVGLAVAGSHLAAATRQWVREMDVPPSELAKLKWDQAKTATAAGASTWRTHPHAQARLRHRAASG